LIVYLFGLICRQHFGDEVKVYSPIVWGGRMR